MLPSRCMMPVCAADRLQRLAASAPNVGAVQDAVALAFPPSQGSAKRAEKFKQFFADVMPAGSKLKVSLHHSAPVISITS